MGNGSPYRVRGEFCCPLLEHGYGQGIKACLAFAPTEELSHLVVWGIGSLKKPNCPPVGRGATGLGEEERVRF